MGRSNSELRQRSTGPKRKAAKKVPAEGKQTTDGQKLKRGERILVAELRVGDRIVTSWHSKAEAAQADGRALTDDEVMDILQNGEERFVKKSVFVKEKEECPSQWRTHVHVNRGDCYDERGYIWVVKQ